MPRAYRILVLGGYGHFGSRICTALAHSEDATLIIAGRDGVKAGNFARVLSAAHEAEHESKALDSIDISIAPGQQTPRGVATLEAVLSYCGKPFEVWEQGRWRTVHGWQELHRFRYPDLGSRWLACCDVPDLQLFPARYAGVQRVRFDAGLELTLAQWAFWLLAASVRVGLIDNASRTARFMQSWGRRCDWMGSDSGGMHVGLRGADRAGRPARIDWHLVARRGHGPQIPCMPALMLARKLAAGTLDVRGAMPCMGLMTLAEFAAAVAVSRLDISWRTFFS